MTEGTNRIEAFSDGVFAIAITRDRQPVEDWRERLKGLKSD